MPQPLASSNLQRRLRCVRARRRVAGRRWQALLGWAGLRSITRKPSRMLPPNSVNVAIMRRTIKLEGSIADDLAIAVGQEMGMTRAPWITRKGEIDEAPDARGPWQLFAPSRLRWFAGSPCTKPEPARGAGSPKGMAGVKGRRAEIHLEAAKCAASGPLARPPGDSSICQQILCRPTRAGPARRGPRRPAPGRGTRDWLRVLWLPHRHR